MLWWKSRVCLGVLGVGVAVAQLWLMSVGNKVQPKVQMTAIWRCKKKNMFCLDLRIWKTQILTFNYCSENSNSKMFHFIMCRFHSIPFIFFPPPRPRLHPSHVSRSTIQMIEESESQMEEKLHDLLAVNLTIIMNGKSSIRAPLSTLMFFSIY